MPKQYAAVGYGPISVGTISTAGWTSTWRALPYPYQNHAIACKMAGSTGAITGTATLQGRLGSTGSAVTLCSWGSTLTTGIGKDSTNNQIVTHVRITSTGFASTASTGTVAVQVTGTYCAV